jgi:DNA repair exonuclease SbcCD ATPase subunit
MNKIGITSLSIRNFKGIKSLTFEPDGNNVSVYGTNGTGKTTIFDAVTYLLFGKDSLNSAIFEIKPIGDYEGDTEVAAVFSGQKTIELKKVYQEKWVKRRGSADREYTGNTTNHFIDCVPVKKKEFDAEVADICRTDLFFLLTNPRHFNEVVKWEDRRAMLLDVCGDITVEDVIASDKELADLPGILGNLDIEKYKKIVKARLPEINREIEKIPVRIDEAKRAISDMRSEKTVKGVLVFAESKKEGLEEKLSQIVNGGEVAIKRKEIAEIEKKSIDLANADLKKRNKTMEAYREKKSAIDQDFSKAVAMHNHGSEVRLSLLADKAKLEKKIEAGQQTVEALRKKWFAENEREQTESMDDTHCPACGQSLPPEQVEQARQKDREKFNLNKAEALENINRLGKVAKEEVAGYQAQLEAMEKRLAEVDAELETLLQAKETAEAAIKNIEPAPEFEPNPEIAALTETRKEIEAAIKALIDGNQGDIDKVKAELDAVKEEIRLLNKELTEVENAESSKTRIADLKKEERTLAAEYEKLEGHMNLMERFTRAKVSMLTNQINSKFSVVEWKLYEEQLNGGLSECCVAMINGVPYASLNSAGKIWAGAEIINVLQKNHGIHPFTFFDNCESVVSLPDMECQIIKLYVSEADEEMRIVQK